EHCQLCVEVLADSADTGIAEYRRHANDCLTTLRQWGYETRGVRQEMRHCGLGLWEGESPPTGCLVSLQTRQIGRAARDIPAGRGVAHGETRPPIGIRVKCGLVVALEQRGPRLVAPGPEFDQWVSGGPLQAYRFSLQRCANGCLPLGTLDDYL